MQAQGFFLKYCVFFSWSIYRFKGLKIEDMTFAVKILLCLQTSQYRGFGDVLIGIYRPKNTKLNLGLLLKLQYMLPNNSLTR